MQYNNTSLKNGIIQAIEEMTDLGSTYISSDTDRLREFTNRVNRVSNKIWHIIHTSTGNWSYDDGGYTDLPTATTDLVSGQSNYALPSDALTVKRIELKDKNDNWIRLNPIIEKNIPGAIEEFHDVDGDPVYYSLKNGVITLYPATNYNQSNSLKVYYERASVEFEYDDTTATPGFASPYHDMLPIGASIEWYKVKQPQSPTLPILLQDYARLEMTLKEFYGRRFKDYVPRISRKQERFK